MTKAQKEILIDALRDLSTARDFVELVRDELQESFDERSERAQENERGQELAEEIQTLESICESLTTAYDDLQAIDGVDL